MGFSFSLKNANAVGHLVDGNVITFLDESAKSHEIYEPNLEFIDRLVRRTYEDFYTSPPFWAELYPDIRNLREEWETVRENFRQILKNNEEDKNYRRHDRQLLYFFNRLSGLLSRCKVKTLLLPGFEESGFNRMMSERNFLQDLVSIHPGDSALILQIKERISKNDMTILNAFSKFETAFDSVDMWPGVLFWNDNESLFLKAESEFDVVEMFEILRFEKGSFNYLRKRFENRQNEKKHAYFFHLSDLHFGDAESNKRKLRITRILENQLTRLNDHSIAIPIITGDLMDSPTESNKNTYLEFCELIKSKGFETPIQLLGNHDVDTSGIIKRLTTQKSIISSLSSAKSIEVIKELDLAFIKFNSNSGGNLAQGQIGTDQLMTVGNEIDALVNKDQLNFIALLHHHPKEIENPDWYAREWYEAFLGRSMFEKTMKLVDADMFLEWIENRGIKLILHGHKHIPKIHNHNDVTIVAAGSATGKVKHREPGKTFLSYNLIKYDIDNKKPVSCQIIAEDIIGSGTKNLMIHPL